MTISRGLSSQEMHGYKLFEASEANIVDKIFKINKKGYTVITTKKDGKCYQLFACKSKNIFVRIFNDTSSGRDK